VSAPLFFIHRHGGARRPAVFVQSAAFHTFFTQMFVQIDEKKFPQIT